jgi:bifunctional non-homologous end joining protein LigD
LRLSAFRQRRRPFSSLLCGVYEAGSLVYTGRVGTGFSEEMMEDLMPKLRDLEIDRLTIENSTCRLKNIRWLRPQLICEVKFSNWTNDGIMRHASFVGLRTDKKPEEVHLNRHQAGDPHRQGYIHQSGKAVLAGRRITKEDVIAYYRDVAEVILPYLKDRPQSLYRTPSGIIEKGFFQKNVRELAPDWIETVELTSSDGQRSSTCCARMKIRCSIWPIWAASRLIPGVLPCRSSKIRIL